MRPRFEASARLVARAPPLYAEPVHPIAEKVLAHDQRATARACRLVDDRVGDWRIILKDLFPHTGRAWTIGVTGNPGAGKSTLTDRLITLLRGRNKKVAVVAVDPTSPFSGGAILGDRIRMQDHAADPEVFIRSLATRGTLGGLSRSAADTMRVLDAWGADVVLVETVGVGQDELEITRTAHTTLVVMAPGLGDDIQASKAGLLECADVFAVNKADREGADGTMRDLELMIALGGDVVRAGGRSPRGHTAATLDLATHVKLGNETDPQSRSADAAKWIPPILKTIATRKDSVDVLFEKLELHRAWLFESEAGAVRRATRLAESLRGELREALLEAALESLGPEIEAAALSVGSHAVDPYSAADDLVAAFRKR